MTENIVAPEVKKRRGRPPRIKPPESAVRQMEGPKAETLAQTVVARPGAWATRKVDSRHTMYASFDAMDQFMTKEGTKTGQTAVIKMEDGSTREVKDIMPAIPQAVRIVWPIRLMQKEWRERK